MPDTDPITARAWRDRTETATRDNIAALEERGIELAGPLRWTDPDGITIQATAHGEGAVTIEVLDNPSPFKKWTIPVGWLEPGP